MPSFRRWHDGCYADKAMPLQTSAAARLASTLSALKELGATDRSTHLRVLRETLDHHPNHVAVWAVWDADALDGNDQAFAGAPAHDSTGRFRPLWHRRNGEPCLQSVLDDTPPHLKGSQRALLRRRPVVLVPHLRPFDGVPALLATLVAPIMLGQRCVGTVGMDFALDTLAGQLASGVSEDATALLHLMGEELEAGLVFLDCELQVLAFSGTTKDILNGFTARPVETGRPLPVELRFDETGMYPDPLATTIERRGITLTATRSLPTTHGVSVLVLTASATDLKLPPLSPREDEVMLWLSEGKSNEEIGIILSISHHTVKNHLDRIYRKIGVDNRHAAMLAWSRAKALSGTVPCP